MEISDLIKKYLAEAKMLQLATSADNQPWVCNVWFAADDSLNIYWFSSTTRRHSQEVAKNPNVAAAIVTQHDPAGETGVGLQIQGVAEQLNDQEDIAAARSVYEGRIFDAKTIDGLMANPDKPHKFYRLKPNLFVLFDPINFPDETRQEWKPGKNE
ncbi:MAG TPA: pyridoxamine 5'-phosphate oxidase family protein [Candidatus Saccharimonadales bacterium]|nr:pyridoxamine 5'-phosphate oxidase family protein [Candidatus Saccharimonadales bacterium]